MLHKRINGFIKNPRKALLTLSMPILIGMVVQVLYNIVDTAYVGRLGANAIAALTFSFPIFFILVALNTGIAVGMGSRISRMLGAKNKKEAENTAMHGLFIVVILALIIFILGLVFLRPLFMLFGATPEVLELAMGYMRIILIGVFAFFPIHVLSNIFVAQGDTKTPMIIQSSALVLNIILDPIFIFLLKLGVRGAAMATIISFTFGTIIAIYFIIKKSQLKIHLNSFKFSGYTLKDILYVGTPAAIMMLLMSFYIIFINKFMSHFGTNYVAGLGMVSKIESLIVMPVISIGVAMITIVGLFYGAKKYNLLKNTIWFGIKISIYFSLLIGTMFFLFPTMFLRIFTSDTTLLNIGAGYLRVFVFSLPFWAVVAVISRAMQGMGTGIPGLVIHFVRVFIIAIPLSYIFIFILDYSYIWIAAAILISFIIAAVISFIWLEVKLKKINSKV